MPLGAKSSAIYAALAVVLITWLNIIGTTESKWLQNVLAMVLALSILGVVVGGVLGNATAPRRQPLRWPTKPRRCSRDWR